MNGIIHAVGGLRRLSSPLSLTALLSLTFIPGVVAQGADEGTEETLYFEKREEIPLEYRWDVGAIFEGREAWEAARKKVEAALPGLGPDQPLLPVVLRVAVRHELRRRRGPRQTLP
jgi:hypothetical protein